VNTGAEQIIPEGGKRGKVSIFVFIKKLGDCRNKIIMLS